jgi:hypothetical protein
LFELVEVFLKDSATVENVCELLNMADEHKAKQLSRFLKHFLVANLKLVDTTKLATHIAKQLEGE